MSQLKLTEDDSPMKPTYLKNRDINFVITNPASDSFMQSTSMLGATRLSEEMGGAGTSDKNQDTTLFGVNITTTNEDVHQDFDSDDDGLDEESKFIWRLYKKELWRNKFYSPIIEI